MNWFADFFRKFFSKELKAQEQLDKNYPLNKRSKVEMLLLQNSSQKKFTGPLSLKGFVNLRVLNCRHNRITKFDLSDCKKLRKLYCDDNQKIKNLDLSALSELEWLDCSDNKFSDLNFLNSIPNPHKIQALVMCNNQFPPSDLTIFSRFTNLELLLIGENRWVKNEKGQGGIIQVGKNKYNLFYGSLKPLQKLKKLYYLNIRNTDIDDDLEYLPDSIVRFYFEGNEKIENKLRKYDFDLKKWKEQDERKTGY